MEQTQNIFVYCLMHFHSVLTVTLKVYPIQGKNMGSFFIFINFPTCLHWATEAPHINQTLKHIHCSWAKLGSFCFLVIFLCTLSLQKCLMFVRLSKFALAGAQTWDLFVCCSWLVHSATVLNNFKLVLLCPHHPFPPCKQCLCLLNWSL